MCYESGDPNIEKVYDALHDPLQDEDSFTGYIYTHQQNGVWSNEVDASLISYVYEVNINIISNVKGGC